jgi:hypothetical protein
MTKLPLKGKKGKGRDPGQTRPLASFIRVHTHLPYAQALRRPDSGGRPPATRARPKAGTPYTMITISPPISFLLLYALELQSVHVSETLGL